MVDYDKLLAREAAAKEAKEWAREKKEKEEKERIDKLDEYRVMANKVRIYFSLVTNEQLEIDLKKARYNFYKHIKKNILREE